MAKSKRPRRFVMSRLSCEQRDILLSWIQSNADALRLQGGTWSDMALQAFRGCDIGANARQFARLVLCRPQLGIRARTRELRWLPPVPLNNKGSRRLAQRVRPFLAEGRTLRTIGRLALDKGLPRFSLFQAADVAWRCGFRFEGDGIDAVCVRRNYGKALDKQQTKA